MQIKPSSALRNNYGVISNLAKDTGEPIYITVNGEQDGVYLSVEAYEKIEQQLLLRSRILAAEEDRLNGGKTYTEEEVNNLLAERDVKWKIK